MASQLVYEQNTRISAGITEYAWRPSSDTAWDPTSVVWTTTQVAPVDHVAWKVNTALNGTRKGAGSGRWSVCPTCLEEFPISEMVKVKGRYYCTKYRDYEEQQ